jgi:hypothetical protein
MREEKGSRYKEEGEGKEGGHGARTASPHLMAELRGPHSSPHESPLLSAEASPLLLAELRGPPHSSPHLMAEFRGPRGPHSHTSGVLPDCLTSGRLPPVGPTHLPTLLPIGRGATDSLMSAAPAFGRAVVWGVWCVW